MKRAIRNAVLFSLAIGTVAWLTGCGGGGETAGYDIPTNPNVIYFTPVLRVADSSGDYPFADAEVWLEDEPASPLHTHSNFAILGTGYPSEFQGNEANWIGDIYSVARPRSLETTTIHVRVYATGYATQETTFLVKSDDPSRLFGYERLEMSLAQAVVNPQGAAAPVKTHQGTAAAGPPIPPGAKVIPLPKH